MSRCPTSLREARTRRQWAEEQLLDVKGSALFADGFDEAIVGVTALSAAAPVVVYDVELMVEILVEEGMSEEDAWDHLGYNVLGGYVGEDGPLYLTTYVE